MSPSPDDRLDAAVAAWYAARESGQPLSPAEFLDRYPHLRTELESFLAGEAAFGRCAGPAPDLAATQPYIDPGATRAPGDGEESRGGTDPTRAFGDYELLEEIGRGGMGIVFKARQVSLNRIVALKRILAGQLASETDVRRFRAEAEAAANLDHPNILPVYEVGEHQGQRYFSMKLVTGGSLAARMTELRGEPRAAVALLAQVARAVHFAHQRGVLHRDLKPGNVLLDSLTPYVADFGLAKRVEGDSGLTASGAVVGTPSYMPPEQARAEKALTVAADVYSLGAILYELLTGRPPFRSASQLDTLLQVLEQEPEPPRQVNPAVARDLETVCLKCLAKEPAGRYASAADLADELERWLAGETVSACPPTRAERLARWGGRNPAQLALALALLIGLGVMVILSFFFMEGTAAAVGAGVLATFFFALLILQGHSRTSALEKHLRRERPPAAAEVPVAAAVLAPSAGAVPRGDLWRALWRGARNGAFLGVGAATSLVFLPWPAFVLIRGPGAWVRLNLWPAAVAVAATSAAIAVLVGAAGGVLARALVRPFGRVAWGWAWLAAGFAVLLGTADVRQLVPSTPLGKWQLLMLATAPAGAVYVDWWTRFMRRQTRRTAAAGQIPPERARILQGMIPVSDFVVKTLPVLLLVGGVMAGHFPGAAAGRILAPAAIAQVGPDFGALLGRVTGALAGALVAVGLLRLYRVAEGAPWPGQADRPYPRTLAALYLSATAALAALWFL